MHVQLSVQIAKELLKPAKQRKNLRQNFEMYQNALNIMGTAGFWTMFFATLVIRYWRKQLSNAQPQEDCRGALAAVVACKSKGEAGRQCVREPKVVLAGDVNLHGRGAGVCTVGTLAPRRPHAEDQLLQKDLLHLAQVCPEGSYPNGYVQVPGSLLSQLELELLFPLPKPDCSESNGNKVGSKCSCWPTFS